MSDGPAIEDTHMPIIRRWAGGVSFELSPRWVRVRFGGSFVAGSKRARLLLEPGRTPVYYFPVEDVREGVLVPARRAEDERRGRRVFFDVVQGGRRAAEAAWRFDPPSPAFAFLVGHVAFYFQAMEAWFEEDDEIFVHPRDPYKRVDVLRSSRHVRVEHAGEVLAESTRPSLLFETDLPTRYYLPRLDVRLDLLEPSATRSRCPYKGQAVHYSARIGGELYEDIAWSYPAPIPECSKIENLICFYQERVDAVVVDGEKVIVEDTPWSRPRRPPAGEAP